MNGAQTVPFKSPIAYEILAYLVQHPQARDSLDGIVRWWLLEQTIRYQATVVKEALEELALKGYVIQRNLPNSLAQYELNATKREEIIDLLNRSGPHRTVDPGGIGKAGTC